MAAHLELVVLGVGAGATATFSGEPSSAFVLRLNSRPVLMLDVGVGAVRAALQHCGQLAPHIYVSHNHTDHAGELPVVLAVEAAAGRRKTVLAEAAVLQTLQQHRLAELASTGRPLCDFADFTACTIGQQQQLGRRGLAITLLLSRHEERCCGLLLHWHGTPVLGWSADSGADAQLYAALAAAPLVLLDGRARGSSEHASFDELQQAAAAGVLAGAKCCCYGYGTLADAPPPGSSYPDLTVLSPGDVLHVASCCPGSTAVDVRRAGSLVTPVVLQPSSRLLPIVGAAAVGTGAAAGDPAGPHPAAVAPR